MLESNSQELIYERSQSLKYSLLDMNFETNFELLNQGQANSPAQSSFFLSLQHDNNLVFNCLTKQEGKPLLFEFPPFQSTLEPQPAPVTPKRIRNRSKPKVRKVKESTKKGLREISQYVKDLITKRNGLTYSEVARYVIEENKELRECFQNQKSTAVNIKRRVYDVLAVLSSLKLLNKDSKKKIYATNECHKIGVGTCKNKEELYQLNQSISEIKESIKEKSELLKTSLLKYQKLTQLTQRNIKLIQQQNNLKQKEIEKYIGMYHDSDGEQSDMMETLNQRISLPFMYVSIAESDKVKIEVQEKSVALTGVDGCLLGDVDMIMQLPLPECGYSCGIEEQIEQLVERMKSTK